MLSFVSASVLLGAVAVSAQSVVVPNTSTGTAAIAAEQTAVPNTPTSQVKGKVFDRFVNIMMENQDFPLGASDRELALNPQVYVVPFMY
jgi:acid phosphatase